MKLTQNEMNWASKQARKLLKRWKELNTDNWRIANADVPEEVAAYEDLRSHGCCGSMNLDLVHPTTGRRILVGCNYGH